MFKRHIEAEFRRMMQLFPVVVITGPRQSGKTTLSQYCYPDMPYINLEEPDTRDRVLSDPRSFFDQHPDGAILDEIQRAPDLMSYIQAFVDKDKKNGRFILTGSHQLQLHQAISQSLAGRAAMLELLPLTIDEMQQGGISLSTDTYLKNGFYPGLYDKGLDSTTLYRNYVRTYIERDVRQLVNVQDLNDFQRFMMLLAGRVGSILNVESLANDVGVAHNTIKNWLSILEASYLIYRLHPYFENFGKRVIKSPKLYFNDVGLVSYLLSIETEQQMQHDRLRGNIFENLVILELKKYLLNQGRDVRLFYHRDHNQNEIDVIIPHQNYLIPVEIKSSATYNKSFMKNIEYYKKISDNKVPFSFLVYAGNEEQKIKDCFLLNYKNSTQIFDQMNHGK